MIRSIPVLLLAAALATDAQAAAGERRLATAEPGECAVIEQLAGPTSGPIRSVAAPAPGGDTLADYRATLEDAKRKHRPVSLRSCKNLRHRLGETGNAYSRVALSPDGDRAVVDVDCGPVFLRREKEGRWRVDASYVSAHGCQVLH
ncbi:hypothetical protein [Caulobacter hibisci]|uniref:Uncharacterized protein n=1 Tax=Caulobacter hibisci TaxID=2035993 RepID=A0ABS0SXY2_9CAUL|nr:hypothetical protein [Caulobacter hibisci]MBI1683548.1 hypothetical protein [Caulobacter hibisci]